MRKAPAFIVCSAIALSLGIAPAHADKASDDAAKAAIAILGIAALLHDKGHYRDGYAPKNHNETADFEMGYRDGLHNERFDPYASTGAYAQGYDAGQKERTNRLSHRSSGVSGVKVPKAALDSCFNDAVNGVFQTNPHNVHVVKAAQEGGDNFYIELAYGHKHVVCSVNSKGEIFNTEYRRL